MTPGRSRNHEANPSGRNDVPLTKGWIIQFHDAWSRVTLSSFYTKVEENLLSDPQYAQWIQDRARIAVAIAKGAAAAQEALAPTTLPLCAMAQADAAWFLKVAHATASHPTGPPLEGQEAVTSAVNRLISLIEGATSSSSSKVISIAVLWAYMCVSYQAWSLSYSRVPQLSGRFRSVSDHVRREGAIENLLATQDLLELFLSDPKSANDVEKAKSSFEEVLKLINDILDQTLYIGEQGQAPLCVCGRKGHLPSQCTFKSHI